MRLSPLRSTRSLPTSYRPFLGIIIVILFLVPLELRLRGASFEAGDGSALEAGAPAGDVASPDASSGKGETPEALLRKAALIQATLDHIERLYLNVAELEPPALLNAALLEMARVTPDMLWVPAKDQRPGGLLVGRRVLLLEPEKVTKLSELPDLFASIFAFYLQSKEMEQDPQALEIAAVQGMLRELDRPSKLLIDSGLEAFNLRNKGALSGIGCTIGRRQDEPTVIEVLEDSPASEVGLQKGDKILRVDGESTVNMNISEVVSRIRGPTGTDVKLEIRRGQEPSLLSFTLVRREIRIENVEALLLPGDVGYLRITNFNELTVSNYRQRISRLAPPGGAPVGLIIDLRGNSGGSLKQSAYMADEFLHEGTIVETRGRDGQGIPGLVRSIVAEAGEVFAGVPIAILVDERTASGAEILAGSLKYLDRAVIIGQRTFGKGTVQKVYTLQQKASLKLTVAKYVLPGEHLIQTVGIQPDIELLPFRADDHGVRFFYRDAVPQDEEDNVDDESSSTSTAPVPAEAPLFQLPYLIPLGEVSGTPVEQRMADTEIRLAVRLLTGVKTAVRETMLREAGPLLEVNRQEEAQKIHDALKERGVDWSDGPSARGASVNFRVATDSSDNVLHVGQDALLRLDLTNVGTSPLSRLVLVSRSDDPLLNQLEFIYGRVQPGQTQAWPVLITPPSGAAPGLRKLDFAYRDGVLDSRPAHTGFIYVKGSEKPALELEVSYEDIPSKGSASDRRVQPSEEVIIHVTVRNGGPVSTGQIQLSLRNPLRRDLEIREGRKTLDPIEPGKEGSATLSFLVLPGEGSPSQPPGITLEAMDRSQDLALERDLEFAEPWTGQLRVVLPRLTITSQVPREVVTGTHLRLTGTASSASGIRELAVRRGREKVQRILPALTQGRSVTNLDFDVQVPLVPGGNRLTVVCTDEAGLSARSQVHVEVTEIEEAKP